jgi:hypothetical protein
MKRSTFLFTLALVAFSASAQAAEFRFDTNPFAGSTAPGTPGRQVVGGEPSIVFDITSDIFSFAPEVFGGGNAVLFANDEVANLPATGVNIVVNQTLDNDANPATPFGAGQAANLLAAQITDPGPGFFIYFNSGLDLARLVFSTDLSDNTADLKILARMTNLSGATGIAALPTFTESNFAIEPVPEPSTLLLTTSVGLLGLALRRRKA